MTSCKNKIDLVHCTESPYLRKMYLELSDEATSDSA